MSCHGFENYLSVDEVNLPIQDRLRMLRNAKRRANRLSWPLTHPREQEYIGHNGVEETVRDYQENFVPNDIHIVEANNSEDEESDTDNSRYFEDLRSIEDSESEESQDSRRDNRVSDNNEDESENNDSGPEDDNSEDEQYQKRRYQKIIL